MARAKGVKRVVRCYLCGARFEVSTRTLSTACPSCFAAIKVEDVVIKSYLPVNDLQTCGKITITKRGRVAARRIQCGDGIVCEGTIEGSIETDGEVQLGPKASWKGKALQSRSLHIADGAKVDGVLHVPWKRPDDEQPVMETRSVATPRRKTNPTTTTTATSKKTATKKATTKKTTTKKTTTASKRTSKKPTASPTRKKPPPSGD